MTVKKKNAVPHTINELGNLFKHQMFLFYPEKILEVFLLIPETNSLHREIFASDRKCSFVFHARVVSYRKKQL